MIPKIIKNVNKPTKKARKKRKENSTERAEYAREHLPTHLFKVRFGRGPNSPAELAQFVKKRFPKSKP